MNLNNKFIKVLSFDHGQKVKKFFSKYAPEYKGRINVLEWKNVGDYYGIYNESLQCYDDFQLPKDCEIMELPNQPMVPYKLTSQYVLYYGGKAIVLKTGSILHLAGFELSKHTANSPFHFFGDIVRIPNCVVEKF